MEGEEEGGKQCFVRFYDIAADMNKGGMERGKKGTLKKVGRRMIKEYYMEDMHTVQYPFLPSSASSCSLSQFYEMGLFVVVDGHGGRDAAMAAADLFPAVAQEILEKVEGEGEEGEGLLAMDALFEEVERRLKCESDSGQSSKGFSANQFDCEGCTATAVFIYQNKKSGKRYLQVANVGDSTAFLCRKEKSIPLSVDHSAAHPEEIERLKNDFGVIVEEGNKRLPGVELAVSRALGDFFAKSEEVKSGLIAIPYVHPVVEIVENDAFVIVASDGLWDIYTGQEVADMTLEKMKTRPQKMNVEEEDNIARMLITKAMQADHCHDNITAILVGL
uniref:PPM-type phosphatase domain-containing protein n=1 Tax=Paramoeba aestuarina TaxID=180227 RepID=A0A7S4NT40_9EUKA